MLRISQIKVKAEKGEAALKKAVAKELRIQEQDIFSYKIKKRSLDARKKPELYYVYTVDISLKDETKLLKKCKSSKIGAAKEVVYAPTNSGSILLKHRPVIIGMGPAGLFCALSLARAGFRPILLERGMDMDKRQQKVNAFWENGDLDSNTNIQFGEGGAGTFSDGKLNTAVKDATGRNTYVLNTFVEFGAPEEILWLNKPHIGTDLLRNVIKNIRKEIERLGGEVRFESQVTDLCLKNGHLHSVIINEQEELLCEIAVLAIGHSARDTFAMLKKRQAAMTPKAFAVGVRMEHPQTLIDQAQYGKERGQLPAADYKLTCQLPNGRGAYSFCMCPGGYVVNASSEQECLAVNGMSYHSRDGKNANSAIVVTVTPEDFEGEDVLAGVEFQRKLERAAYQAGKGKIPVQLYGDFCKKKQSQKLGTISPALKGGWIFGDVRSCFPKEISDSIEQAVAVFGKKIKGFDSADALLCGVESRTSSPVRIERERETLESNLSGLYPCGEGAGYAGGITSASMDGLKVAEAILKKFKMK